MIYSEDLGKRLYSDRKVHCCFNIYKCPENRKFNKKPNYILKDVEIREYRDTKDKSLYNVDGFNYDIRIMAWGGDKNPEGKNLIGKEVEYPEKYAKEFCIKVYNEKYKEKVLDLLKNVNWLKVHPMTITPNLLQWQVYKYIKDNIPDIS